MDDLLAQWENLHLKVGSRARITGLASRADLNGLTAVITPPANAAEATSLLSKGRVKVSTTKDDLAGIVNDAPWITLSVKPTNSTADRRGSAIFCLIDTFLAGQPSSRAWPSRRCRRGRRGFERASVTLSWHVKRATRATLRRSNTCWNRFWHLTQQPAAAFNLAQLYRNKGEMTRAIKMIEGTAILLSNSASRRRPSRIRSCRVTTASASRLASLRRRS